jgi:putative zinc finger/helix-turn-helix YgiT family protein
MMKPYPWKCGTCYQRGLFPATIPYTTERQYDGQVYTIPFPALDVLKCQNCGAIVLNDEACNRITEALQRAAGILMPEEIRHHREALGLTQKQLADCVHAHEETVARWERGGQIQNRPMDILLRLFFKLPEVRRELTLNQTTNGTTKETPALARQTD